MVQILRTVYMKKTVGKIDTWLFLIPQQMQGKQNQTGGSKKTGHAWRKIQGLLLFNVCYKCMFTRPLLFADLVFAVLTSDRKILV